MANNTTNNNRNKEQSSPIHQWIQEIQALRNRVSGFRREIRHDLRNELHQMQTQLCKTRQAVLKREQAADEQAKVQQEQQRTEPKLSAEPQTDIFDSKKPAARGELSNQVKINKDEESRGCHIKKSNMLDEREGCIQSESAEDAREEDIPEEGTHQKNSIQGMHEATDGPVATAHTRASADTPSKDSKTKKEMQREPLEQGGGTPQEPENVDLRETDEEDAVETLAESPSNRAQMIGICTPESCFVGNRRNRKKESKSREVVASIEVSHTRPSADTPPNESKTKDEMQLEPLEQGYGTLEELENVPQEDRRETDEEEAVEMRVNPPSNKVLKIGICTPESSLVGYRRDRKKESESKEVVVGIEVSYHALKKPAEDALKDFEEIGERTCSLDEMSAADTAISGGSSRKHRLQVSPPPSKKWRRMHRDQRLQSIFIDE